MTFWRRWFGRDRDSSLKPRRLNYLNEALALERQGDYDAALTSYRLALRDNPADPRVLQNLAIAYTKISQFDEAIRHYRRALDIDGDLAGAHYGLAFLLLQRGETDAAETHLREFLSRAPKNPDADRWIEHARRALAGIETRGAL
jgi:tetratricopeptide (TPR) repeat protein